MPHPSQAVTVRGQLVFDALVIANVWKDGVKHTDFRGAVARNEQPTLIIICRSPTVFMVMDFPPALGPLMTSIRCLICNSTCWGRVSLPASLFVCCSSGWKAESRCSPGFFRIWGKTAFQLDGQTRPRGNPIELRQAPLVALDGR